MADADPVRNLHLAILLKRLEYNVFVASNPPDLLRIAGTILPNVILLDMRMPFLDGQTCLEKLRSNHRLDYIKIITVSDEVDSGMLRESLKNGANAFVTRPVNVSALYAAIQGLTESRPRKIPRLRVIFKVTVLHGNTGRTAFATMISEKGIFVRTLHPLEKGTDVKLTLDLPSSHPLVLDAAVIYQVRNDRDEFVEPGMGLLFKNVAPEVSRGLREFIEHHLMGDLETEMII